MEQYRSLVVRDAPEPEVGPGDALIRVRACGICGSDVHGYDGSTGRRIPPIIMGHEAAGIIAAVGRDVTGWRPGDRVTFDSTVYCGDCHFCRRGQINLCDNRRVLGVSCADYRLHGAFAEYVAVPQRILYRLPDSLSFEHAALAEALSVAFHAVSLEPPPLHGAAVVVGAGMIGLLLIQALRHAGCRQIIAVDLDEGRLALARKLGASAALVSGRDDAPAEVARLTDGLGADAAFEVVGLPVTVETAVRSVRKGGAVTLVGNVSPTAPLPLQAVVTREIRLAGSCASRLEYPACLDLIARGLVDVNAIISAVAPLADGPAWFERLYAREAGVMKVVLRP
jgi:L-iditol 2-dehydrogenase